MDLFSSVSRIHRRPQSCKPAAVEKTPRRLQGFGVRMGPAIACIAGSLALAVVMMAPAARGQAQEPALVWPAVESPVAADPDLEARVLEILSAMTLEQKIGQMVQAEIKSVTPAEVKRYHLGSVLNGGGSFPRGRKNASVADWLALADAYYDASMSVAEGPPIPLVWGTDAVHGHNNVMGATLFPHNIALGATGNAKLVQDIAEATAAEVAVTGIDWVFAPTVAVVRNDRWGRTYEGYSEDPEIIGPFAEAAIRGLQGAAGSPEFLAPGRVLATAKHFIGDGGTRDGIDQGDNLASELQLRDIHGRGYFHALGAGAQTVMVSFNSWRGSKLHGNRYLLTEVLKNQMGFDGLVVSDWNGIGQVSGCGNASCPQAVNAGIDMIMVPEDWKAFIRNTLAQVRDGEIPMERIDDAVSRILRVKLRAGLFERGRPSSRPLAGKTELLGQAGHRALARQAVRESLVLLKNSQNILPLSPSSRVLVAGDGADNIAKQSGGWTLTWQGTGNSNEDFPGATSIFDGIRRAVAAAGGEAALSVDGAFDEAPDVAIVVFGEEPYAEGQGDLEHLSYSAASPGDLALLRKLKQQGIPVVSIFLSGRPLWVNPEINASDAFVLAWLPGSEGGGISDVLFSAPDGNVTHDFVGRLRYSWPANPGQVEVNRHDPQYQPQFPYGYGLDYGQADPLEGPLPEDSVIASSAPASHKEVRVFDSRVLPPFRMMVGDKADWQVAAAGTEISSRANVVSVSAVDLQVQEDARQASWSGAGDGQFFFQADQPMDLRSVAAKGGALEFFLRVDNAPTRKVTLRMGCVYPCASNADITNLLRKLPEGTWTRLTLDLQCFAQQGLELERVDVPLLILTGGRLKLSIAGVRIVPDAAAGATISCQGGQ
jgi:beta-glucosidase